MEDLNMLGADCIVISCCCQCLILQILIFVLLKLPYKLVKKTREYAKKKLQQKKKGKKVMKREKGSSYIEEIVRIHEQSFRIEGERAFVDNGGHSCGCCMEEVEKVMEEFSRRGEFAFGSFWGKEEPWGVPKIVTKDQSDDDGFVRYQIIEMVGSLSCA